MSARVRPVQALIPLATGIRLLADAISGSRGTEAVALRVAEQYIQAFGGLARASTTMMLPTNVGDPAAMGQRQRMAARSCVGDGL